MTDTEISADQYHCLHLSLRRPGSVQNEMLAVSILVIHCCFCACSRPVGSPCIALCIPDLPLSDLSCRILVLHFLAAPARRHRPLQHPRSRRRTKPPFLLQPFHRIAKSRFAFRTRSSIKLIIMDAGRNRSAYSPPRTKSAMIIRRPIIRMISKY